MASGKVRMFSPHIHLAQVPLYKFCDDTSNISSDIQQKPYFISRSLNDLCDLGNKVKVTQFKLGLHLALVLLCTKFGEDTSNISSDIERKPSFISRHLI